MKITPWKNNLRNKVWRDFHWVKILHEISYGVMLAYGIFLTVSNPLLSQPLILVPMVIVSLLMIYVILAALLTKLTYITNNGIRVGNSHNGAYTIIPIKKKADFILWKDVDYIMLINKVVRPGYVSFLKPFLVVKTTKGKRYDCFIACPGSFLKALKRINKDHLVKDRKSSIE